jgi:hypothetical protein
VGISTWRYLLIESKAVAAAGEAHPPRLRRLDSALAASALDSPVLHQRSAAAEVPGPIGEKLGLLGRRYEGFSGCFHVAFALETGQELLACLRSLLWPIGAKKTPWNKDCFRVKGA